MACQQDKLDAARAAYHNLMTGAAARVIVDQNGERVEFVVANAPRLAAYIAQLEAQCAAGAKPPRPQAPFGYFF